MRLDQRIKLLGVPALLTGIMILGCSNNDGPTPVGPQPGEPAAKKGSPKLALFLVKDGKPFVMADLGPDSGVLQKLNDAAREEFLLRTALDLVVSKGLDKPEYQDMSSFVVRLVLASNNEYSQPKWGLAVELTHLEVERAKLAGLTREQVDALSGPALRDLFLAAKFGKMPS